MDSDLHSTRRKYAKMRINVFKVGIECVRPAKYNSKINNVCPSVCGDSWQKIVWHSNGARNGQFAENFSVLCNNNRRNIVLRLVLIHICLQTTMYADSRWIAIIIVIIILILIRWSMAAYIQLKIITKTLICTKHPKRVKENKNDADASVHLNIFNTWQLSPVNKASSAFWVSAKPAA